jgi:sugar O-acyltransferase (sialic acid O-acetyltransferase NeuD family)
MSKPKIILIGAGAHAKACIDVIEQQDIFQIAGLVGLPSELHLRHLGYGVIGNDTDLSRLVKENPFAIVATGQLQTPDLRMHLWALAVKYEFQLPGIIAPTAYVSRHSIIGSGTVVMHGAIVNSGAKVCQNCIINSQSLIEHDVLVEDHCHVSTGAILNGNVRVGAGSFIGSGTVIKEGVTIGKNCVLGMGLSVRHDLADHSRFVGKAN